MTFSCDREVLSWCLSRCPLFLSPPLSCFLRWNHRNIWGVFIYTSWAAESSGSGASPFPLFPSKQYPYVSIAIRPSAPSEISMQEASHNLYVSFRWLNPETQVNFSQEFPHQATLSPSGSARVNAVWTEDKLWPKPYRSWLKKIRSNGQCKEN